ncbi:4'-phosphopantetheinyl transferase family protein [Ruminococcus albus]|uniref:4'-phosphopantetheinyl transferase n=1 Tax=Ruminococcus albus (strain ATCC 27210 / DSM 20455 / JCM 14654 / NCDO 2250 / 7) TaxID=697329 RepID=E6UAT4_RUMA7|nr:4'-phosphopantetheinyl transferase superfamily protein [Ruminococcus albus]ADU21413.1 4'-phosphopantetheinyl transferase [Ruminococcus albus 7 = DSM 20455]
MYSELTGICHEKVKCDPFLVLFDAQTITDAQLEKLESILPPYRVKYAERYRKREDRVNSMVAFAMLAYLLKTCYHTQLPQTEHRNAYGKPLLDAPLQMSISHCSCAVCCAVASGEVGVDVQELVTDCSGIAELVLSGSQYETYCASDAPERCFTEFWTQKEAYLKLQGTGLTDDLSQIDPMICAGSLQHKTVWYDNICISTCSENPLEHRIITVNELRAVLQRS